jgi:hypothetical protein
MKVIEKIVHWAAEIGSIIGVIALFFLADELKAIAALVALVLFLIAVYIRIHWAVTKYLSTKYPRGFTIISSFSRYSTSDGRTITHDLYRTIQCKRVSMTEFWHEFYWTGSEMPRFTSRLQTIDPAPVVTPDDQFDRIRLLLHRPIRYNETDIIHIAAACNDADEKSQTQVSFKVDDRVQLLHWRVELLYLPDDFKKPAVLERRRIVTKIPEEYEAVTHVSFDHKSKSYEHLLHDPSPDYFYRLRWERR